MNKKTSSPRIHPVTLRPPTSGKPCGPATHAGKSVVLTLAPALSALLLVASHASAAPFFFSTGNPDHRAATLARRPSATQIETETADDFILTKATVINSATFTGLRPAGSTVLNAEVEIYHVFPFDSPDTVPSRIVDTNNGTANVPTRNNSPADGEIDDATRDGADGSLTFSVAVVNSSFHVTNSVVNKIKRKPDQRTGGEGPVDEEEITITLTFNPPIVLPANSPSNHYFFRPEVELSSGDFLWLTTAKPIVAPGTPFAGDLQSWIRADDPASIFPDWLRIGTDIVATQGMFNAAFSLSGETHDVICPQDIVVANERGGCDNEVAYEVVTSPGITATCVPPSGSSFPVGTTTVTCTASSGETCSFTVTVQDTEAPQVACRPAPNPGGKKIPPAGKNGNSGGNPDGFFQLLAKDNCDSNPTIFVTDSASGFIAGPFKSGDIVKITQSPNETPFQQPGPQDIVAHIRLQGDPLLSAVDAAGNVSSPVDCFVPPPQ